MFKSILLTTASLLLLTTPIHAVCGIHTFGHCEDNITHWYDPLTGEVCDLIDCGGGRAPPKPNAPGCGNNPLPPVSYLSCWTPGFTGAPGPPATVVESTTAETVPETTAVEAPSTVETTTAAEAPSTAATPSTVETLSTVVESPSTKETTAVASPTTGESEKGSSTVASSTPLSTPETTAPAVLPSSAETGAKNGTVTSVTSAGPSTTDIAGAGAFVKGSVMAVVGAVVGAVMLV